MKNNYTKEDYEIAKSVSLIDYLSSNGYTINQKGNRFYLKPHDSLVIDINKNVWYWFAQNQGGNVIDFLMKYENFSLVEAVNKLAGNTCYEKRKYTKYEIVEIKDKGEIELPAKNIDNKRAWSYLTKTRQIDTAIINSLLKTGDIYQNDKGGVVFVGKDSENNVKFACVRSTSQNSKFRQDIRNSNKEYSFKIKGNSDKLFVFESPIDLLSHATISKIQGKNWQDDNRLSLGGVSDKALEKYLKDNDNIKEIILFLDNDTTGLEASKNIYKKYIEKYKVNIFTAKYKDVNETLIKYKEELKINKTIDIKDFFYKIKNPFIIPKLKENYSLKEFLKNIFKENEIGEDLINNLLEQNLIGITDDNKLVFFIKNSKGENIGAYEFDVNNFQFEKAKLLENSNEKPIIINSMKKENKNLLIVTDNILGSISFNNLSDTSYINNFENISQLRYLLEMDKYSEIDINLDEENSLVKNENFLNNIKTLKKEYPEIKIQVTSIPYKELHHSFLKKEYLKPLDNKTLANKIQENKKLIEKNNILKTPNLTSKGVDFMI